ncbi:hypothetical protein [Prosthecobacter sp.]|uniref:hypothetical protein n=1 Tax=Prosthecobacter sp. TaxID=1965333 RepID=UPI00248A67D8|nr:hypothetical protein [Prosthecobacter sp.]MDI1314770.1 hypothetical protein [Prosthecobacter sp.]
MIHPDAFDGLIEAVAKLNGLERETAGHVVADVGDTPAIDIATGKIVATLPDGRKLLIIWPEDDE